MSRFSFSFQHETPTSLQIEATELFLKAHEPSFPNGSESDFLSPSRQVTSSSMEETWGVRKSKIEAKKKRVKKTVFMVVWRESLGFWSIGYC